MARDVETEKIPMRDGDASVPLTTWHVKARADEAQTKAHLVKALWPARSDRSLIPPRERLAEATKVLAAHCPVDEAMPGKPILMDNSFMLGDDLLCWQNDFSRSCVYHRTKRR